MSDFRTKLHDLSPSSFENLAFDLLILLGLSNVRWRTPGTDGGRDIEASEFRTDLAGFTKEERWYVECKRYDAAVSWPTLREKIAYAENAKADFLLLITSSTLSPQCLDEVYKWNDQRKLPNIRAWGYHDLEPLLRTFPILTRKYGLSKAEEANLTSIATLLNASSKFAQSANSARVFGVENVRELEVAAAISEFCYEYAEGEVPGLHLSKFNSDRDAYEWMQGTGVVRAPAVFVRVISSLLHIGVMCDRILLSEAGNNVVFEVVGAKVKFPESMKNLFHHVSILSDMEFNLEDCKYTFLYRGA